MAKRIDISPDGTAWHLLPGASGEITREGTVIEDTVFGQTYRSGLTGPITWSISADAVYKGFAGYVARLMRTGTSTAMTNEPCALVGGRTFRITATARRLVDRNVAYTVFDGATNVTAQVERFNFLLGEFTFRSTYTVVGAITITGNFLPLVSLARFREYTLTMTSDPIPNSDMPALQANAGWHLFLPGLKTVNIELPSVFSVVDNWAAQLALRNEFVIEINPDGTGFSGSFARGFFRLMNARQSGNIGALEEESIRFELNVPFLTGTATTPFLETPFTWFHAAGSPIPLAIRTALDRWLADLPVHMRYLHNGVAGWRGEGVITNLSLTGGMEAANRFAVTAQMSGAPVTV